jgi:GLPGLI family protein
MYLDIDKNGSNYYSQNKICGRFHFQSRTGKADQIVFRKYQHQQKRKSGTGFIQSNQKYPDFKTYLFRSVSSDQYKIREDQKPEWKILSDKQKIGEYNTQKATTSFGGREWIAWFSTDIPFQDGPYKFLWFTGTDC